MRRGRSARLRGVPANRGASAGPQSSTIPRVTPHLLERVVCPGCNSHEVHELYRCAFAESPIRRVLESMYGEAIEWDLLSGGQYVLDDCPSCSLIYQRYVPDDVLAEKVYERWVDPAKALHRRERHAAAMMGQHALEVLAAIDYLGRKPEQLRFLDFGMGWGYWLRMARAYGVDAAGVEVAESRLVRARELGLPVIPLEKLAGYTFDFINTEQVFEHLADPATTARELAATLRPGGILRISVPNARRLRRRLRRPGKPEDFRRRLGDVMPFQHLNAFVHRSLIRMADRAGLRRVPVPARLRYRYAPLWMPARRLLPRTVGLHYRALRRQDTVLWFTPTRPQPARAEPD